MEVGDQRAAVRRALNRERSVHGGEPVPEPDKPAPVGSCAADSVVAHFHLERARLDARPTAT
jgi:hypothetical protein